MFAVEIVAIYVKTIWKWRFLFTIEIGFHPLFRSMELIGNSVKIRSCPRNCKLCRSILSGPFCLPHATVRHGVWEGDKSGASQETCLFHKYNYLKLSGERLGWIYNIIIYIISTKIETA